MKDLALIGFSALLSSVGLLYWLHDGDLEEAVEPVVNQWTAPTSDIEDTKNDTPAL